MSFINDPIIDEGVSIIALMIGGGALLHTVMQGVDWTFLSFALTVFGIVMVLNTVIDLSRRKNMVADILSVVFFFSVAALGEYVAAAWIAFSVVLCRTMYNAAIVHAHSGVRFVVEDAPTHVLMLKDGNYVKTPISEVKPGDIVRYSFNTPITLDGTIVKGSSHVDTCVLTGEKTTKFLKEGDRVMGGSLNVFGILDVEVSSTEAEGTFGKLVNLLDQLNKGRSPVFRETSHSMNCIIPVMTAASVAVCILTGDIVTAAQLMTISIPVAAIDILRLSLTDAISPIDVLDRYACVRCWGTAAKTAMS